MSPPAHAAVDAFRALHLLLNQHLAEDAALGILVRQRGVSGEETGELDIAARNGNDEDGAAEDVE